jgi:hypothetical protein
MLQKTSQKITHLHSVKNFFWCENLKKCEKYIEKGNKLLKIACSRGKFGKLKENKLKINCYLSP